MPVALDQTYDYLRAGRYRGGARALSCWCRSDRRPASASSGTGRVGDGKPVDHKKLKSADQPLDAPPLPAISLRFAEWVARYSLTPLGMVARMMMSADAVFEPPKPRFGVCLVEGARRPAALTAGPQARPGALRPMAWSAPNPLWRTEAGCSTGVIDGLVAAGTLVEVAIPERAFPHPQPRHATTDFTLDQARAVETLRQLPSMRKISPSLCSMASPARARRKSISRPWRARWKAGGQALIMLPEIALTSQFMDRFARPLRLPRRSSGIRRCARRSAAASGRAWRRGDARVRRRRTLGAFPALLSSSA